ncbi:MAG TPA: alpha/beta fold hydrolase [Anaerolineales bacterium]
MLKTTVNGFELAYERRGHGTPLVLIHGYPLDHTIWNPVVPLLENDFDLILPDLRGFGESGTPTPHYSTDDFAADLISLLDQLGIQKAAIVGHSMGGYVALAFARCHPSRLRGLGLVASQALPDAPEKKEGRYQEAEHILAHGVRDVAEGMSIKLTADPVLQTKLKELMLRQRPEGLAGALRAMAERQDSMLLLTEFDFPVVLVHGLADKLIPVERARDVRDMVKRGYLTEIEAAGHMPMMEAPQVTAEALKTLL